MNNHNTESSRAYLICILLVTGTALALAGIDLVLPAVPALPVKLGTSEAMAQIVIAAFVFGVALGLLVAITSASCSTSGGSDNVRRARA